MPWIAQIEPAEAEQVHETTSFPTERLQACYRVDAVVVVVVAAAVQACHRVVVDDGVAVQACHRVVVVVVDDDVQACHRVVVHNTVGTWATAAHAETSSDKGEDGEE